MTSRLRHGPVFLALFVNLLNHVGAVESLGQFRANPFLAAPAFIHERQEVCGVYGGDDQSFMFNPHAWFSFKNEFPLLNGHVGSEFAHALPLVAADGEKIVNGGKNSTNNAGGSPSDEGGGDGVTHKDVVLVGAFIVGFVVMTLLMGFCVCILRMAWFASEKD